MAVNNKEALRETSQSPNFYIKRAIEGLAFPSSDQLIKTAKIELKAAFRNNIDVPQPPAELFETLQGFAERGITRFDEVYYLPGLWLKKKGALWRRGGIRPWSFFWERIDDGNFPAEAARLEEGWYIGDRRGKPMYANGQQRYGEDDYMDPLMAYLRDSNRIQRYSGVPDYSRFGASAQEIEVVILPAFEQMSGAKGTVRNRRFIEFNVRGNINHREWGQTNTREWFGDRVLGTSRLFGGDSSGGGLANVDFFSVGVRNDFTGFSPVVVFSSKP